MSFIYQADVYCDECGQAICDQLKAEGKAPADPGDQRTYDSDEFPKLGYTAEESDCPEHCAAGADCKCALVHNGEKYGMFFENELTEAGYKYVLDQIFDDVIHGRLDSIAVQVWGAHYRNGYIKGVPMERLLANQLFVDHLDNVGVSETVDLLMQQYKPEQPTQLVEPSILPVGSNKSVTVRVPTYVDLAGKDWDYDQLAELTLREEDGIRIIMGDPADQNAPNLSLERRGDNGLNGWAMFVRHDNGDDDAIIYWTDTKLEIVDKNGKPVLVSPRS